MGPKCVPGLIWLDQYGNPILSQSIPEVPIAVTNVIASWKGTLSNIERFFKEHQDRGDKYMKNGKLREAYVEYSIGAKFKGPSAEKAKEALAKVTESWMKVLAVAAKFPIGSRDSTAMLKGLREEVKNLDFAVVLEKELLATMIAADSSKTADDAGKVADASKTAEVADAAKPPAPAPVEASNAEAPVAPAKATAFRTLAEVASAATPVSKESTETGINVSYLAASTNPVLKQAAAVVQHGITDFQKATADTMDRGAKRNELLKSAHTDFDKSLTLMEEALAAKSDDVVRRLEERVSMLLYASLKYQSL